jgi:endo-1,4-beta-xylanase
MKFEAIHPHADEYDWNEADSLVSFAQDNQMVVRGHTLLWGNRNPYWLFWDEKGNLVHRKQLELRMRDHIQQVVSRYKGKVYAWDVVNEAVYDNDKEFLKTNTWYKIMGADYIRKAFQFAHEADSSALLFYNDYDAEEPGKLNRIVKLIKWLQAANVPIHGMGIQGHWTLDKPSVQDIDKAINVYAGLGLQVQITELDIKMPLGFKGSDQERLQVLASRYAEIFEVFHKNRNKLSGITFWQTEDVPMKYPPLFDAEFKTTEVYQAILNAWSAN